MKNQLEKNSGITLIMLIITVIVMLIIAGVSVSLLNNNKKIKKDLVKQENVLNTFYNSSSQIESDIKSELQSDYEKFGS